MGSGRNFWDLRPVLGGSRQEESIERAYDGAPLNISRFSHHTPSGYGGHCKWKHGTTGKGPGDQARPPLSDHSFPSTHQLQESPQASLQRPWDMFIAFYYPQTPLFLNGATSQPPAPWGGFISPPACPTYVSKWPMRPCVPRGHPEVQLEPIFE